MLIRPINESDNKHIAVILRQVLIEMDIPRKGSAFEDPEIDKMYESYQSNRSISVSYTHLTLPTSVTV